MLLITLYPISVAGAIVAGWRIQTIQSTSLAGTYTLDLGVGPIRSICLASGIWEGYNTKRLASEIRESCRAYGNVAIADVHNRSVSFLPIEDTSYKQFLNDIGIADAKEIVVKGVAWYTKHEIGGTTTAVLGRDPSAIVVAKDSPIAKWTEREIITLLESIELGNPADYREGSQEHR